MVDKLYERVKRHANFTVDEVEYQVYIGNKAITVYIKGDEPGRTATMIHYRYGSLADQCKLIDRFGPDIAAKLIQRFLI